MSHPAWGAWIEIEVADGAHAFVQSRTPHGVRGLKSLRGLDAVCDIPVAPRMGCVD